MLIEAVSRTLTAASSHSIAPIIPLDAIIADEGQKSKGLGGMRRCASAENRYYMTSECIRNAIFSITWCPTHSASHDRAI